MDQDFSGDGAFGRTGPLPHNAHDAAGGGLAALESNAEFREAKTPTKRVAGKAGRAEPTAGMILPRGRTANTKADALWAEFQSAFGDVGKLNLQATEAQYAGLRAIARLYRHHAGQWSYFLASKKIKRVRTAKSDFQPIVKFGLSLSRDANGHATKLTATLDEWAKADPPIPADQLPVWVKSSGGVKGVYQSVRDRERPPVTKDERDTALHDLIESGFLWETDTPDQLAALDGDYLALVHFDSIRRTVGFRAVDPKVDQGWLRINAKRLVASRVALDSTPGPTRSDVPVDPFMTKPELAKHLYQVVKEKTAHIEIDRFLEPSCGDGAFFNLMPPKRRLGIDIRKRIEGVIEHDFLTFTDFGDYTYGTVGNPPFGKNAPLKFFNRAARISAFIAFIVPTTFKKPHTVNKLDPYFHLIHEEDVPHNSFVFGGQEEHISAVFQIWERREARRDLIREVPSRSGDLEFLPAARMSEATIWFQRLGVNAGRVKDPDDILTKSTSPESHFFIRCDEAAANILRSISWRDVRQNASGPPNISQTEIVDAYELAIQNRSSSQ